MIHLFRSGVLGVIMNEKALAMTVAKLASLALVALSTTTLLAPEPKGFNYQRRRRQR